MAELGSIVITRSATAAASAATGAFGAEPHRCIQRRRYRIVGDRLKPLLTRLASIGPPHRSRTR